MIPSGREHSVKYTVRIILSGAQRLPYIRLLGALNWATGETVAIKEIQLSNIPKSEIGQIMVSTRRCHLFV